MSEYTGSRVGRRAEQRAQRRKQRRRIVVAAVTAFALLLAAVVYLVVRNGGSAGGGKAHATRTQRTLLFQIQSAQGTAISSALLAHDPKTKDGAVVLIPPQVLATVPGIGSGDFGNALKLGGVTGSRNALSDLMGVTIDGSWVVDGTTFARLVDTLGGVNVNVDVPVTRNRVVLLTAGQQRLTGANALLFATYAAAGEQEAVRLTRLQAVFDAILNELPKDTASLIGSLGSGSQTSGVKPPAVAAVLTGLEADDASENLQYQSLPVTKVDVDEKQRFRLDAAADKALVDDLLAQSIPPGVRKTGNRVLVLNGVGTPGLGDKVRSKIVPAGFVFVGSRNAPRFGYTSTLILIPNGTQAALTAGRGVAKAMGLPGASVETTDEIGTIADVVVIVGSDFKGK